LAWWKKDFAKHVDTVLGELREKRRIDNSGGVSLAGSRGSTYEIEPWLCSALELEVSDTYKKALISRVICSADLGKNFNQGQFCKQLSIEKEKLSKETQSYWVVTPLIGVPDFIEPPKTSILGDVKVAFFRDIAEKSFLERAKARREQQWDEFPTFFSESTRNLLRKSSHLVVECVAISAHEAQEVAYNASSVLLGILNFTLNAPKYSASFLGSIDQSTALNDVSIGPQITVHDKVGNFSTGVFWFDPWKTPRRMGSKSEKDKATLQKNFVHLISVIEGHKWKAFVEKLLIRYNQVFSKEDKESALLGGWRVLESAAGGREVDFSTIIARAANCTAYREEMIISGLHLKYLRNSLTHGHISQLDESERMVYELHRFLRPLLNQVYFMRHEEVATIDDLWALLDLPEKTQAREELEVERERTGRILKIARIFFRDGESDL
jgi:hypothetical protein